MSESKVNGLTTNQKLAIIGAVAIISIVLAASTLLSDPHEEAAEEFSQFLYESPKSGIIMDVRNSPSTAQNSIVMQCGVNLIADGFFAKTQKDLLVYACDNTGCLSQEALDEANNSTNSSIEEIDTSKLVIPFDEALYNMRSRAYFHIQYSDEEKKDFHGTYVDVFVNSSTDPQDCRLDVKFD